MLKYTCHADDRALAEAALEQSGLPFVVNLPLLCDVYCIPSHNHQTFYLQIFDDGEYYLVLYAKPLITTFLGTRIAMYSFNDALFPKTKGTYGDIFCGMKYLQKTDPTVDALIKVLPVSNEITLDDKTITLDGITTLIRNFRIDPPAELAFDRPEIPFSSALPLSHQTFLLELYIHLEKIIGNVLTHAAL
ncbi:MAG: hypothetical protein IJP03_02815 [Christensenellaceae bacterium]|nr:hypothetical protein [Christensenellaceae bacterium]